ncbi:MULTISPECIES: nucleotidyltransferase domain-containing protein [Cytobacillus]|uniref:nucleotidyltransferase domain-containing protein n=1 Tax=Cytobacillus TaxID=2675230 RepID=UPI001CD3B7D2|nr:MULTISPECIES: nucleotidyltransferase domain-containing protein [Cytobacillus]MCA1028888.1 nucleotidyltransferase domain-containing protein [Cytobacillus kochii]MCM3324672.1 nucleotidyltransferase domain-containing protein [Cytobacillus kochii]MCM3347123.1 nucleotidyltransferase domain-containing protein [Cytobacillus kochii]MDM5205643.1 nucleotidyltransferase domain-containing protein [Cytobacillus kochii]
MATVDNIIQDIKEELDGLPGVVGVVLGGSRARGTHSPDSDIDIGIYYDESKGFNTNDIEKAAFNLNDDKKEHLITSLGEWGDWIDGGGWLVIQGYHVDLIFRDIKRVSKVIDDCLSGLVSIHYQTGHPHGYLNAMYMGELAVCNVLSDPEGTLSELKKKTEPYPEKFQEAMIQYFSFEASFSLMFMEANANKNDISYVMGHCFRSISCLNQVIFSKNKVYCINEKKAVDMIQDFSIKPINYKKRIDEIVSLLSTDKDKINQAVDNLKELIYETEAL